MLGRTGHVGDMSVADMIFTSTSPTWWLFATSFSRPPSHRPYLSLTPSIFRRGECELRDPDGHVLMLAQSDANTP